MDVDATVLSNSVLEKMGEDETRMRYESAVGMAVHMNSTSAVSPEPVTTGAMFAGVSNRGGATTFRFVKLLPGPEKLACSYWPSSTCSLPRVNCAPPLETVISRVFVCGSLRTKA